MRSLLATSSFLLVLLGASAASAEVHQGWNFGLGSTSSTVTQVFPDSNGVTQVEVTVDAATVTIGSGGGTFNTRAYHLHDSAGSDTKTLTWPGPIWYAKPGGYLNFTIHNNLGANPTNDGAHNAFRTINTTNMHTHGLHADPDIDSIFREAAPGETLNYYLPIVDEHAPGTHWYHAHKHGAASLQMMGGLFGMNVIMPSDSLANGGTLPTEIAGLTEEIVMIHPLKFTEDTDTQDCGRNYGDGSRRFEPFRTFSFGELETETQSGITASQALSSGMDTDFFAVNGHYQPTIQFNAGEVKYFRFVHAAVGTVPQLSFGSTSCNMTLVAIDGVFLETPRVVTTLKFIAGRRMDVIMDCSAVAAGTNFGINHFDPDTKFGTDTLIKFQIRSTAVGTNPAFTYVPASLATVTKPYYLASVENVAATNFHSVNMRPSTTECHYEMGEGTDCPTRSTCPGYIFDGQRGNDTSKYHHLSTLGDIEEWHIAGVESTTGTVINSHPMHIHVNHFMLVSWTASDVATLEAWNMYPGVWYDTLAPIGGDITIRWKTHTFPGETIFHCHAITHEDRGLMSSYLVQAASTTASTAATSVTTTAAGNSATSATTSTTTAGTGASTTTVAAGNAQVTTTTTSPTSATSAEASSNINNNDVNFESLSSGAAAMSFKIVAPALVCLIFLL